MTKLGLWYQLPFSEKSSLCVSDLKPCLDRALACCAARQTGTGITLTASVLTSLNLPFALVSLHQPQHRQLWPASPFRAISSIVGAVSWVPLRPGAWGRCSEDSVHLSHIITSVPKPCSEGGAMLAQGKVQKSWKRVEDFQQAWFPLLKFVPTPHRHPFILKIDCVLY